MRLTLQPHTGMLYDTTGVDIHLPGAVLLTKGILQTIKLPTLHLNHKGTHLLKLLQPLYVVKFIIVDEGLQQYFTSVWVALLGRAGQVSVVKSLPHLGWMQ